MHTSSHFLRFVSRLLQLNRELFQIVLNIRDYLKASTALPAKKCFIDYASTWMNPKTAALGVGLPIGGAEGVTVRGHRGGRGSELSV